MERRILVLGDLILDRYVWGSATRLSPEAAVPVVDFVSETSCLGGAGNVAANLAAQAQPDFSVVHWCVGWRKMAHRSKHWRDDRKKQVLMVSYFQAGTQWAAKKGSSIKPDDA